MKWKEGEIKEKLKNGEIVYEMERGWVWVKYVIFICFYRERIKQRNKINFKF